MRPLFFAITGAAIFLAACQVSGVTLISRTEDGLVFGTPAYARRDVPVAPVDREILISVRYRLQEVGQWSRLTCDAQRVTLFCALQQATQAAMGQNEHRQPAMQEVRFAIDDLFPARWREHRLRDFNQHPETTLHDILAVVDLAVARVDAKLTAP